MNILTLTEISKIYGDLKALDKINLTVEEGEWLSIMGPSGSGKTTLMNIIGCMDKPSLGKIDLAGQDISKLSSKELTIVRRDMIGLVFQQFHLVNYLTALENVMMPALVNKNMNRNEAQRKAKELLALVGLAKRLKHKPMELSGGEKQRVAIARAMINDPDIILADEPTGNLDTETSNMINELFMKINQERNQSIIIVTHSLELANLASYKYKIENGEFNMILPTIQF